MRAFAVLLLGVFLAVFAATTLSIGAGSPAHLQGHGVSSTEIRRECSSGLHAHHQAASVDDDDDDDDDDGEDCDTVGAFVRPIEMSASESLDSHTAVWADEAHLGPARGHATLPEKPPRFAA